MRGKIHVHKYLCANKRDCRTAADSLFGRKEKRQEKEISSATAFLHHLNKAILIPAVF
jgi:hypothetical protein